MKNTIRALTIGALQGNFGFDPVYVHRTQLKRNKYVTLNSENHGKIKLIFRMFFLNSFFLQGRRLFLQDKYS